MKHSYLLWAMTALVPVAVLAQGSLDEEVNAELDRMYQSPTVASAPTRRAPKAPSVQVNVQAQPAVTTTQSNYQGATQGAGQTATVAQSQGQVQYQAQPQKQPTTYIEASPLTDGRAEKIRRDRQDAELSTEAAIVEKLERSRLEDEKRRAEVLFGDKFNTLMNQNQPAPQPAPVYQPAPQPVPVVVVPEQTVQPAPVIVREEPKEKPMDRDAIRSEVSAALADFKTTEQKPVSKTYVAFLAGAGDYPDAVNVQGQYSFGVALGKKFDDRLVGEGSFLYSSYQVEQPPSNGGGCVMNYYGQCEYYPRITDMNQYSTSGLVKYQLMGGTVRPELGGLMSYTYRTFTDKQFAITDATVTSQALDFGIMTGVSIEMSESFSLGLDYRYMWNLTNKVDGTSLQKSAIYQGSTNYTPIEQLSYWNLSVAGRATF